MVKPGLGLTLTAVVLACILVLVAVGMSLSSQRTGTASAELDAMAEAMHWRPDYAIAEIGAGKGTLALSAARRAGPGGRVWANEIAPALVENLRKRAVEARVGNLTVVEGAETDANLPDNCCDVVFMRWVYHHFSHPAEMNRSLYRAVKPGGSLAVIDFRPRLRHELKIRAMRLFGVRDGRETLREGIDADVLKQEVAAAGFLFDRRLAPWLGRPGRGYCLIFRKPDATGTGARRGPDLR